MLKLSTLLFQLFQTTSKYCLVQVYFLPTTNKLVLQVERRLQVNILKLVMVLMLKVLFPLCLIKNDWFKKLQMKKLPLIGAHVSITGGLHKSIERAMKIKATTMQIFTRSNRQWSSKEILQSDAEKFKQVLSKSEISSCVVHCPYIVNIGCPKKEIEEKSLEVLIQELKRCQQLDVEYLVLHPGAALDTTEDECISKIASNLNIAFENVPGKSMIILEQTAGQGSNVGYKFDHIKDLIDKSLYKERLGVCLDTAHLLAAGYDLTSESGYHKMMKEFEEKIGIERLKVWHINNSKKGLNSRVDRHECLEIGPIPMSIFKLIMNDKRLSNVPKILETPNEEIYEKEIQLLKDMVHH